MSLLAVGATNNAVQTNCYDLSLHSGRCDGGWRERGYGRRREKEKKREENERKRLALISLAGCVCARACSWRGMDSGAHGDGEILSELVIRESDDTFRLDTRPSGGVTELLSFTATFSDDGFANDQSNTSIVNEAARAALFVYVDARLALVVERNGRYENISLRDVDGDKSSVVTLRYYQENLVGQADLRRRGVQLSDVVFQSRVGVAVGVAQCAPGTFADDQRCTPCPPGKSSRNGEPCSDCPAQTYAPTAGSRCLPCGGGATSGVGAVRCAIPATCLFQATPARAYDLSTLIAVNAATNATDDRRLLRGLYVGHQLELSPCLGVAACTDAPTVKGHVSELKNGQCRIVGAFPSFVELNATELGADASAANDTQPAGCATTPVGRRRVERFFSNIRNRFFLSFFLLFCVQICARLLWLGGRCSQVQFDDAASSTSAGCCCSSASVSMLLFFDLVSCSSLCATRAAPNRPIRTCSSRF